MMSLLTASAPSTSALCTLTDPGTQLENYVYNKLVAVLLFAM